MKHILCYGDSNTFGYVPITEERYSIKERWTGILQNLLGKDYRIIEEGCGGRTTVFEDPIYPNKNGKEYLLPCIESHKPLDLVIIMLGTNDLKTRFNVSTNDIAHGMKKLVNIIQTYDYGCGCDIPKVLIVSPIRIGENVESVELSGFSKKAVNNSEKLAKKYEIVAKLQNCYYFDAASVASPSEEDSVHITKEGHSSLSKALYSKIKEILQ